MRRCTRCILSEKFLNLTFDQHGVCSVCRAPSSNPKVIDYEGNRRELERLLARERTRGNQHDCVLGFSGGKDSIFSLHLLRRELGARPLLVNFDSGYGSETSRRAMEASARTYDVELVVLRAPELEQTVLLRELFQRTGEPCMACDLEIYAALLRTAQERGIGLLVMGGGASEGLTQVSRHRAVDVFEYAREVLEGAPIDLERLRVTPDHFEAVRLVQMGDCFVWDHQRIKECLDAAGISLVGAEDGSWMHNDCRLCQLQSHVRFLKRGYGRNEPILAALVRSGTMDREEALRQAQHEAEVAGGAPEILPEFCARIGCDRQGFYETVADPNVVYRPPWYHGVRPKQSKQPPPT